MLIGMADVSLGAPLGQYRPFFAKLAIEFFFLPAAKIIEQVVEISSVVFVFEVAEFMKNHEIGKIAVQPHKMNIEIYIVLP